MSDAVRNAEICRRWIAGESHEALGVEFGLATVTCRKITKKAGLSEKDRDKPRQWGTRAMVELRPISTLHAQIGHDVSRHRSLKLGVTRAWFAKNVRVSRRRLTEIEAGVHDPSLSELLRLAEALGTSVDQLTRNRKAWATSGK
jgi:DNA-binding XRE family transcriptional regulator